MTALREISVNDAAQITSLSAQLGYAISIEDTASQIALVISHPDHCAIVIVENEKIIGWIHAFKTFRLESKPFVEIGGLVVDENYRGKGVGKKLINYIKKWCRENHFSLLRVRTNIKRKDAHIFYNKIGFRESKEQKIFETSV